MIVKALLKAIEINNQNEDNTIKLKLIIVEDFRKVIKYEIIDNEITYPYEIRYNYRIIKLFDKALRIHHIIKSYLQLKDKIWFDESCYLTFIVLRKVLGKDIAQFICYLLISHIKIRIDDNLNKFNKLYSKYNSSNDNKLLDKLFALCEFTKTITFA